MLLATLLATVAGGVTVELPMEATCRGTEITLDEIATIRGDDAELVARVGALELGYAPAPGFSRVLRADRLEQLLERRLPHADVRVAGHPRTRVEPQVAVVPNADVVACARRELETVFGRLEAEFQLNRTVQDFEIPASQDGWTLRARPGSIVRPTSGVFTVPVEVYVDGGLYRIVWTNWRADVYRTRPVLTQTVRAGETLRADMFQNERVRVTAQNDRSPLPASLLEDAIANRTLAPGEAVLLDDVHRRTVIQAGARLQLRVKKGRVQATVAAEALLGGAIGDRIRVKNLLTEEHLTAVVRSRDLVEIDLSN